MTQFTVAGYAPAIAAGRAAAQSEIRARQSAPCRSATPSGSRPSIRLSRQASLRRALHHIGLQPNSSCMALRRFGSTSHVGREGRVTVDSPSDNGWSSLK